MAFRRAALLPDGGRTIAAESTADTDGQPRRERAARALANREHWSLRVIAPFQLPVAVLGLWPGGYDLLAPAGIASKVLGLLMFVLGVLVLAGVMAMNRPQSDNQQRLAAAGTIAGVMIAVIYILTAIDYQNGRIWLFALSGVPSAVLASLVIRWQLIRANAGLAVATAVASAAVSFLPFVYNTLYLPTTTDISIESSLTAAAPVPVGKNLELVDLTLTVENLSTTEALNLTSMIEVEGVTYGGSGTNFQDPPNQQDAIAVGTNALNSTYPNLDTSATGTQYPRTRTLITLRRPIGDASFLHTNLKVSGTVPVLLPAGKYRELQVTFYLIYARADRLTLGRQYFGPRFEGNKNGCRDDVRTAWHIAQTKLDLLARGEETLVTDWCATVGNPRITAFIGGAPGSHTTSAIVMLEDQSYQTRKQTRLWDIELPAN